jgi:hypothetical protein
VHLIPRQCEFGVAAGNTDDAKPRAEITRERRTDRKREVRSFVVFSG